MVMISLYVYIISIMMLTDISGILFFTYILKNNLSFFGQNFLSTFLCLLSIFFIFVYSFGMYTNIKKGKLKEKLKTNKGKYLFIQNIVIMLIFFTFFVYPQYLSKEAININNKYKEELNKEKSYITISENAKIQSYIVPKFVKEQRLYAITLLEKTIDYEKEISDEIKKESKDINKRQKLIEKGNNILEEAKNNTSSFYDDIKILWLIGFIICLFSLGLTYFIIKEILEKEKIKIPFIDKKLKQKEP